jgi:predicted patatin/cPLA2 family phospholipase
MKIFSVNPNKDLPINTIEAILQKASDIYRTGIIKLKD